MRDEDGRRRHTVPRLRVSKRSPIYKESSTIQPVVCYIGRFVALFSLDERGGKKRRASRSRCNRANCDFAVKSSLYRDKSDGSDRRNKYLPSLMSLQSL